MRAKAKKKIRKKIVQLTKTRNADSSSSEDIEMMHTSSESSTKLQAYAAQVTSHISINRTINRSIEQEDIETTLKCISLESVKSVTIAGITLNNKKLDIFCDSLSKNPNISVLTLTCQISRDANQETLVSALMSLTSLRSFEISTDLNYNNLELLTQVILNNPYISSIKSNTSYQPKSSEVEVKFAKAITSSKYLTRVHTNHKFGPNGTKALSVAYRSNQSLISLRAQQDTLNLIKHRQTELKRKVKDWISLSQGGNVKCNITTLFHYAYNHYPAFLQYLGENDTQHNTRISESFFFNIERFLWSYNLGSVCKKALLITRNVKSDNMDQQKKCRLLNLHTDVINYILCIAQEAPFEWRNTKINWRREITEKEFDAQLECLI